MPKGIYKRSEEARKNMSKARKGIKLSKEIKEKISKSKNGHKVPFIIREKISKAMIEYRKIEKPKSWKGGKKFDQHGYVCIYSPTHPFAMKNKYVLEHRLVVEVHIGRYLIAKEIAHHIGKKDDNRPTMLMAFTSQSAHMRFHKNPDNVKSEEIIFDGRKL